MKINGLGSLNGTNLEWFSATPNLYTVYAQIDLSNNLHVMVFMWIETFDTIECGKVNVINVSTFYAFRRRPVIRSSIKMLMSICNICMQRCSLRNTINI